jgi:LysW-gamma-L-lysine carboxypeptidase
VTVTAVEARALLREVVSTPSVSGAEAECASVLVDYFEAADRTVYLDDVGNVRAPANDAVLLTSHLDTVSGTIPVREENGALWGRGSVDAKGALTAMAVAAVETGVSFVGVVGEEADSRGAKYLVTDREQPETLVNGEPSGWEALTLGYRGMLAGRYRTQRDRAHSSRPENNAVQDALDWWGRVEACFEEDADAGVFEVVTAKPVAITAGQTDEGRTEAQIEMEIRLPPSTSPAEIRAEIETTLETGSIQWESSIPAIVQSPRTELAGAFRAAIRSKGGKPTHLKKSGTSDMNVYATAWTCPMLTYGPGDSSLDHAPDEHLQLQAFQESIDVLQAACTRLTHP